MNSSNRMVVTRRTGIAGLLLLLAPAALLAGAAPELGGDWQGKLAVNPATSLTVRFTFTKGANGAYTAVVNSPDNSAVKDTPVSGVTWDGTNLKFTVPTLQGAYTGKLAGGKIAGEWTQPGGKLPLELAPFQKVALSADAMRPYLGSWNANVVTPGGTQRLAFELKQGTGGLTGTFGVPEQGVSVPLTSATLENGELTLKVNLGAEITFKGKLAGNTIAGKLKVPNPAAPPDGIDASFQRGEYKAPVVALKLTPEAFATLKGKWQGKGAMTNPQNGQKIDFTIAARFETNAKGEYVGFIDSSAQGVSSTVGVNEVTLAGGKLTAKVGTGAAAAEFSGTVAGKKITGEWVQAGQRIQLELTQAP
jgi:hypothetical protein